MKIKQGRVSGHIRKILSELLLREVADPRLAEITITDVELDPELLYAKVWVSALGDDAREADIMLALNGAKGFLRREVAKRVRLRKAPELIFKWDESLQRGDRIESLINSLEIPPAPPEEAPSDIDDLDDEGWDDELDRRV